MFISRVHLVEVFFTKLVFNLKSEASQTYLAYIWWILEPALMSVVFYVVFDLFLAGRVPNFFIFIICGQIPFLWFSNSVNNASKSIMDAHGLINQAAIPKPFFPMLVVFQDAFKQAIVFTTMIIFFKIYGMEISWVWLSLAVIILTQLLLISAAALLVAAITPFLPDFKYLVSTTTMALMFGSGVFYSYKDVLLPQHQQFFLMNPVANLIKNYRHVLMENTLPDWTALGYICLGSLALIFIMTSYYRRTDTLYARLITQ